MSGAPYSVYLSIRKAETKPSMHERSSIAMVPKQESIKPRLVTA